MRVWTVLFICAFSGFLQGQNLIPNPGFEIHDSCPYDQDQLHFASAWFKPTANSTDYYNACDTVSVFGVPSNYEGYQYARSGSGYAGGYFFTVSNGRDYMSTGLLDTLKPGKQYCVEFWVAACDSSWDGIASIGMYFSNTMINNQSTIQYLAVQPQILSDPDTPITDTVNWTRISGIFTAQGGERFIIIGNFQPDNMVVFDTIRPHSAYYGAYYYVDDVSITEIADCNAGIDVSICYQDSVQLGVNPKSGVIYSWSPVTGMNNPNVANPKVSPETTTTYVLMQTECDVASYDTVTITVNQDCHTAPAVIIPSLIYGDQEFFITGLEANSKMDLYDVRGRLIYSSEHYENNFWTFHLATGMYVARLMRPNGEMIEQKVCVVK